jgi:hypothetical protein
MLTDAELAYLVEQIGQPVSFMLAAYRHPRTGRIHFRPECRAMRYQRRSLDPIILRTDDLPTWHRLIDADALCGWCFDWTN